MPNQLIYNEERHSVNLNELAKLCHDIAKEKGWWDEPIRSFGECLLLVHSEISEVVEAYRDTNLNINESYLGVRGKPEGIPIEIADIFIRLFDLCGFYNIDLDRAVKEKILYNTKREYRHGGKKI